MFKKRRGGFGLGGLLVIGALLYFTGAGKWLWDRVSELESQCYMMLAQMGTTVGGPVCGGVGKVVNTVNGWVGSVDDSVRGGIDSVRLALPSSSGLEGFTGDLRLSGALARLGSSQEELLQRLRVGPQSLSSGADLREQLRNAVDGFTLGQRYLSDGSQGEGAYRAVPWLNQGAQVPGFGVMSQMVLGDIYRHGTPSVSADPQAALEYYSQAHRSIAMLQMSPAPEAQQMLKALPASPQVMQRQLSDAIRQIQQPMGR